MSNKALILSLYFVALFIILRNYYTNEQGAGMPPPQLITAPSYLYGVLGITADITGGLSAVLAAGLTLGLFYRIQQNKALFQKQQEKKATAKTTPQKKVASTVPYQIRASTAQKGA